MMAIDLVGERSTFSYSGSGEHLAFNVACRGNVPVLRPNQEVSLVEGASERGYWHQSCTVDQGVRLYDIDYNVDVFVVHKTV